MSLPYNKHHSTHKITVFTNKHIFRECISRFKFILAMAHFKKDKKLNFVGYGHLKYNPSPTPFIKVAQAFYTLLLKSSILKEFRCVHFQEGGRGSKLKKRKRIFRTLWVIM